MSDPADQPRTYPEGVSSWLDLETSDAEASAEFYRQLLGWTLTDALPPGAPGRYLIATVGGKDVAAIATGAAALGPDTGWSTYFAVDDADLISTAVERAGGTVASPPEDNPGGRVAACVDPQGAPFRLWQAGRRLGAQVTNRPGTWNFSDLRTTDRQGAFAFYSAVLPWRISDMGPDAEAMVFVPGYGDHLEATVDPDIRVRQAGAPPEFADAIGSIADAAASERPHWHVTFTVEDRDRSARAVERAGGAVLGLRETQWARIAEVRDPQGATFSMSQFAPQG